MKGLTETLMEEEAREHTLYDKTANAYMFGAAMSSGFGSGFGGGGSGYKPFGFNVPSVVDMFKKELPKASSSYGSTIGGFRCDKPGVIFREVCDGLLERYDWSGHDGTSPHLNQDLLGAEKSFNIRNLGPAHNIGLGFGKDKKRW
ncbi:MAG: hypothetical protein V1914_01905, partial [archaeon]